VQRPAIPVRGGVFGHLSRDRVQPETQEFDRPSTATIVVQIRLGFGKVQPEPVFVKPSTHRCQISACGVTVRRYEYIVIHKPIQSATQFAIHQARQPIGVQVGQQQVAQGHRQSVALHYTPSHNPPEATPFHSVAPDAPEHSIPDPEQRHHVSFVVEHQRPTLELRRWQSAHVSKLLIVHGAATADFHYVHRVHGHRHLLLAKTFLDSISNDRPQFVVHEAGKCVTEIRTHVI